jgi:hypothetical protein
MHARYALPRGKLFRACIEREVTLASRNMYESLLSSPTVLFCVCSVSLFSRLCWGMVMLPVWGTGRQLKGRYAGVFVGG